MLITDGGTRRALNLRALQRELANRVVNQCLRIGPTDSVTIVTSRQSINLAEEISLKCFEAGADALLNLYTDRYYRGYLTLLTEESLRAPSKFCVAFTQTSTVEVILGWLDDPKQLRDVPKEKFAADNDGEHKAHWPLRKERKVRIANLSMINVTRQRARAYGFGYEKWLRAGYEASILDYAKLNQVGRKIADALENVETVGVTAPNGTDLRFSVAGRKPRINDGVVDEDDIANENFATSIPAGSVAVAPVEDSAEGSFAADLPFLYQGTKIRSLRWTFAGGRTTEFRVGKEGKLLKESYEEAEGDKDKIGFLWIGTNPRAVFGYTFDTLVKGAVTIGIGGNEATGGKNRTSFNAHGTLRRASVTADGRTIVDGGKIVL